jgi:hypothetical protein
MRGGIAKMRKGTRVMKHVLVSLITIATACTTSAGEIRVENSTRDYNQADGSVTKISVRTTYRAEQKLHVYYTVTEPLGVPAQRVERFFYEGVMCLSFTKEGEETAYLTHQNERLARDKVWVVIKDKDSDGTVDGVVIVKADDPVDVFKLGPDGYFVPGSTDDMAEAKEQFRVVSYMR